MKLPPSTTVLALAASTIFAAPITTVPWNGHTGAVSFTYDDARVSQLPNLLPQLDSLGIKATFEIAALAGLGNFTSRRTDWLQVSRNGHELTNHTYNHENVTDANAAAKVKEMADTLRGLDPSIQSVTFAYPNCNVPGTTGKAGVSAENFIGRSCAQTNYAWGTQPTDWMQINGLIMQPTNQSTGVSFLNTAKSQNIWATFIIHDVANPTPDVYSITPANNLQLLTTAISNQLWIDTYSNIGAYYRAHFTMDTVKVKALTLTGGAGWAMDWVPPHPKMPKSVPLRVKLDSTVFTGAILVTQDTAIARQPDGSYIIDFMKLHLNVASAAAVSPATRLRYAVLRPRLEGRALVLHGLPAGSYAVSLRAVTGTVFQQGVVRTAGGYAALDLRAAPAPGMYQVTVRHASGMARKVPLLILR